MKIRITSTPKMKSGGRIKKYRFGSTIDPEYDFMNYQPNYGGPLNSLSEDPNFTGYSVKGRSVPYSLNDPQGFNDYGMYNAQIGQPSMSTPPINNTASSSRIPFMRGSSPYSSGGTGEGSTDTSGYKKPSWGSTAAEFALNSAGDIYNLLHYKKPQKREYADVQGNLLDPSADLMQADISERMAAKDISSASGGNSSSYLSNRLGLNTSSVLNKHKIRMDYQNQNAGIKNNFSQFNRMNRFKIDEMNDMNQQTYENMKGQSIGNLGKNAANAWKGRNYQGRNLEEFYWLKKMYPGLYS